MAPIETIAKAMKRSDRKPPRQAQAIADIILSVARIVDNQAAQSELNRVQWTALRFFASANPSSCTVSGFADINGTTHSSASQTISSLERQGYLIAAPGADRRQKFLRLSGMGQRAIDSDPILALAARIANLDKRDQTRFADILAQILQDDSGTT